MEALSIVNEVVTKKSIGKLVIPKRTGPKGYPLLQRIRLLVYGKLKGFLSTRILRKHLQKRSSVLKRLGFKTLPDRRTIDRWKQSLDAIVEQFSRVLGDHYVQRRLSEWTLIDSTPMEDEADPDAMMGYTSKGEFIGFKLHMSCDEYNVPLRATVTTGNVHDSQQAKNLLAPTPYTGGDSAYDAEEIKQATKQLGSKPTFVHNPRRQGKAKKKKTPKILSKVRVCIEQLNGFIKSEVMQHAWHKVKGLAAKTVFALTAVLAVQALAIYNLNHFGYPSIRMQEVRV